MAGRAFLLSVGSLQLRPQGCADSLLLQWGPSRLPQGDRLAGQDQQRKGVSDPQAAFLSRTGDRERSDTSGLEARELQGNRRRHGELRRCQLFLTSTNSAPG